MQQVWSHRAKLSHWAELVHGAPGSFTHTRGSVPQWPSRQDPNSQGSPTLPAQYPDRQVPEQQSVPVLHQAAGGLQHLPPEHVPRQHSAPLLQALPPGLQHFWLWQS